MKYGEDTFICRLFRRLLENKYGIRFAPESIADKFSYERTEPVGNPFGFHGLLNMWHYVKEEEFRNFIKLLHPHTLNSIEAFELAINYKRAGKLKQAEIICRKILELYPNNQNANGLLKAIEIENINGASIFLYAEQGFGDMIQLIGYMPLVSKRCKEVIIECQAELVPLVKNMKGVYVVIPQGESTPEFDFHCSLLMLPVIFDTTLKSIPADVPYITVDPDIAQSWRRKIQRDESELKIGLAWAGGHTESTLRDRSCSLDMFSFLGKLNGIIFYSLQKGEPAKHSKKLTVGMKLIDYSEELRDFSDTTALIKNLDLVISVDTAVAHLAGALGKPVWTLLSFSPDWRWMLNQEDSPWYPTMKLFRQTAMGDWKSVIAQVAEELRLLTAKR